MNFRKAAIAVLQDAGKPLHYSEFDGPLRKKGWRSNSKNVGATIRGSLSGDPEHFVRLGKGMYGLSSSRVQPSETGQTSSSSPKAPPPAPDAESNLSFPDCAYRVLDELANEKPMSYKRITQMAMKKRWLMSNGQTPELTMHAAITRDIERHRTLGRRPRFELEKKGLVSLGKWSKNKLEDDVNKRNNEVRALLRARLLEMDPIDFEILVGELMKEMKFEEVEVTKPSDDGGVDVHGWLVVDNIIRIRVAVQVKKLKTGTKIQPDQIRKLRGALVRGDHGVFITNCQYTKKAGKEASDGGVTPITLVNGDQLLDLLVKYGFGVNKSALPMLEIKEGPLLDSQAKQ